MKKEITLEVLRDLLKERDMKQKDLAPILGLSAQKISRIMTGDRIISEAEHKLLQLYFFQEAPFDTPTNHEGLLNFSDHEWQMIHFQASKEGLAVRDWITAKVQTYLAWIPQNEAISNVITPLESLEAKRVSSTA